MAMADTTPGKIYDIAEKLGYEGARTQSSAKGVYACADALGFVGPHARRITDALSDLKTVVGSGGGGGSYGPSMVEYAYSQNAPIVGNAISLTWGAWRAYAGSSLVYSTSISGTYSSGIVMLATGLTIDSVPFPTTATTCDVYAVTKDAGGDVATARLLDITLTRHDTTYHGQAAYYWSFVINEGDLEDGEFVVLRPHA